MEFARVGMDQAVNEAVKQNWQLTVSNYSDLPVFRHTFSHFHLDITPCEVFVESQVCSIADVERYQWRSDIKQLALAAPVSSILQTKNA